MLQLLTCAGGKLLLKQIAIIQVFSGAIRPTLIEQSCGSTGMAKNLYMLVQISPDRPKQKSMSASKVRGNDNKNVGTCGCFHKGDLHILLTLLR